jgi:hypothetical protein
LCKKFDTEIHIINFFERNNLFIIKEISNALVYTGKYLLENELQFESAFDPFELRQCVTNNTIWYLPKQLIHFLTQTKTSRFNECDKILRNISDKFKYHHGSFNRKTFRKTQKEVDLTRITKIDQNCGKSDLVIFISSSANEEYSAKRHALRKTWVLEALQLKTAVFFVMGEPIDTKTQIDLESEALEYKDIIQFGFSDVYYNLTLKHIALIRWAHRKCYEAKYILKTDDDALVNIKYLIENLKSFQSGMTGHMLYVLNPVRDPSDIYFMPKCIYPDSHFPPYLIGTAYVMTKDTIEPLLNALERYSGSIIEMDDNFLLGILPEKVGIKRFDSKKFKFDYSLCRPRDVCFMFETYAFFMCSANDIIDFWPKWKAATPESCKLTTVSKQS